MTNSIAIIKQHLGIYHPALLNMNCFVSNYFLFKDTKLDYSPQSQFLQSPHPVTTIMNLLPFQ